MPCGTHQGWLSHQLTQSPPLSPLLVSDHNYYNDLDLDDPPPSPSLVYNPEPSPSLDDDSSEDYSEDNSVNYDLSSRSSADNHSIDYGSDSQKSHSEEDSQSEELAELAVAWKYSFKAKILHACLILGLTCGSSSAWITIASSELERKRVFTSISILI